MTRDDRAPCIAVRALRFRYGGDVFELCVPSLAVPRGGTVAVAGASGSGKSTLLLLLAGVLLPDAGTVTVDGVDWAACKDVGRRRARIERVGLVFQEFELFDHLTVRENVLLPHLVEPALARAGDPGARADELLAATGLAGLAGRRPRRLSHGERQRVAICRALVTDPAVVLADEPTGNLDRATARVVLDLLLTQVRARGTTLVLVTHDEGLLGALDQVVRLGPPVAGGAA